MLYSRQGFLVCLDSFRFGPRDLVESERLQKLYRQLQRQVHCQGHLYQREVGAPQEALV